MGRMILSVNADAKTVKGTAQGYLTGILYLAPAKISGYEVCPMRSPGCTAACLYTAGRGSFSNVQEARIAKTKRFFEDRPAFLADLSWSVAALIRKAKRENMVPVVRLNGTSDIPWENVFPQLFETFPDVQFYDYTKRPGRTTPANYHLTFSRSETNDETVKTECAAGRNVAAVFATAKGAPLPATFHGVPVVDGDLSDLRFLDAAGVVVGLRAKGDAKGASTGFVLPVLATAGV